MKSFNYTVKDESGLHARPAGALVNLAKGFKSEILIKKDSKSVNATKLMALMGLGIRKGDEISVTVTGDDESEAAEAIESFFKEKL